MRRRKDFEYLKANSKKISSSNMKLFYTLMPLSKSKMLVPTYLIAFKVSKRLIKKAVCRNRIKRRMRQIIRENDSLHVTNNTISRLMLLFVYHSNEEMSYTQIKKEMTMIVMKFNAQVC